MKTLNKKRRNNMKNFYGTYSAADAFIAGHLAEWVDANKKFIPRGKMIYLLGVMEARANGEKGFDDPDATARHIHMVMAKIEEKIKAKEAK